MNEPTLKDLLESDYSIHISLYEHEEYYFFTMLFILNSNIFENIKNEQQILEIFKDNEIYNFICDVIFDSNEKFYFQFYGDKKHYFNFQELHNLLDVLKEFNVVNYEGFIRDLMYHKEKNNKVIKKLQEESKDIDSILDRFPTCFL